MLLGLLLPAAWKSLQVCPAQFFLFDAEPADSSWSDGAQLLNAKHKETDWQVKGCIIKVEPDYIEVPHSSKGKLTIPDESGEKRLKKAKRAAATQNKEEFVQVCWCRERNRQEDI